MSTKTITEAHETAVTAKQVLDLPVAQISYIDSIIEADADKHPKVMSPMRRAALGVANMLRRQAKLPPVDDIKPGLKGNAEHCVISNTLLFGTGGDGNDWHARTDGRSISLSKNGKVVASIKTPPESAEFFSNFDRGNFDDLVGTAEGTYLD